MACGLVQMSSTQTGGNNSDTSTNALVPVLPDPRPQVDPPVHHRWPLGPPPPTERACGVPWQIRHLTHLLLVLRTQPPSIHCPHTTPPLPVRGDTLVPCDPDASADQAQALHRLGQPSATAWHWTSTHLRRPVSPVVRGSTIPFPSPSVSLCSAQPGPSSLSLSPTCRHGTSSARGAAAVQSCGTAVHARAQVAGRISVSAALLSLGQCTGRGRGDTGAGRQCGSAVRHRWAASACGQTRPRNEPLGARHPPRCHP